MRRTIIKEAREKKNLAAIDLADQLEVCEDRIYSIERGRYRPKKEEAISWAAALDMEPAAAFPDIFSKGAGQ